ncbi:hypothetical protein PIB30_033156 [Stylosanthes scabra]|uniref:Uncharacterized protein n=1 Tax=Stylosanthes scabra TaxID=79078 RepID=A0ABU6Y9R2_9FABA|nr:hypothetical protein [Stylosanthes scabra]
MRFNLNVPRSRLGVIPAVPSCCATKCGYQDYYSISLELCVVGDATVEIVAVRSSLLSGVELLPLELTVFGAYSWSIGNKNPAMWNRFTWGWSRFVGLEAIEGSRSSPSESILLLMESRAHATIPLLSPRLMLYNIITVSVGLRGVKRTRARLTATADHRE